MQPDSPPFQHVAILGLGVMGGSLARALTGLPTPPKVTGWSPAESEGVEAARTGVIEQAEVSWRRAIAGADLIVLAAPLEATRALLPEIAKATDPVTTITDVASLKGPVEACAREASIADRWVGSHPMAGSEGSGYEASRADLYEDARIWIVAAGDGERAKRVSRLWASVGGRPEPIDADEHDELMALASHLPQLTANALADVLATAGVDRDLLGPGGRDMTRLAASRTAMWADLLGAGTPELPKALRRLSGRLLRLAQSVEDGRIDEVTAVMERTRRWSEQP